MRRLDLFNLVTVAGDNVQRNEDKIKDLNINQLMAGLNSEGQPLGPKYSEDPYFKTPQAAAKYAAWKHRLFPETPYNRPNLIIIGTYHDSITVRRNANAINFRATASFASSIAAKYGNKELGLSPDSKLQAWRIIKPGVVRDFCRITGAKSK